MGLLIANQPMLKSKCRGTSLVEVLTAAAVFSLAVLVIFATYTLTLKLNQLAKEDSIAGNIAEETIEQYRAMAFDSITAPATVGPTATTKLPDGYVLITTSNYQDNDKIKQVQVQVYWRNRPLNRAITVTTVKSAGGISN